MRLLTTIERRLQSATDRTFARLFGGHVQPAEVTSALQHEAASHIEHRADRNIARNRYIVELGPSDHADVDDDVRRISSAFTGMLGSYVSDQGWDTFAAVDVSFTRSDRLHTGQFRVISQYDPDVGHVSVPHDDVPGPTPVSEGGHPMRQSSDNSPGGPHRQAPPPAPVPSMLGASGGAPGYYPNHGPPNYGRPAPQDPAGHPAPQETFGEPAPYHQPPPYGQPPPRYLDPTEPAPHYDPRYAAGPPGAAPAAPVLIVDDGTGRSYPLRRGSNIVGRGQAAGLRIADTSVSREHVDVYFDGHAAIAHDLGSTNGTTINGVAIQTWQLGNGDVISIGQSTLIFRVR